MTSTNCCLKPPGNKRPSGLTSLSVRTSPLHRLGKVRRQQGLELRRVASRLGTSVGDAKLQERETTDIPLSVLHKWQEVLDVPVSELLVEPSDSLSAPILKRAQMLRMMKTATAILERTGEVSVRRMAQMMVNQIVEIMPELEGIAPWHAVGQRRRRDEYGRAAELSLPDNMFIDHRE
jgi:transcriptional regulator with XRE-family HTH domain